MERKNMFCLNMSNDDTGYECDELLLRKIDDRMKEEQEALHGKRRKNLFGAVRVSMCCLIIGGLAIFASAFLESAPALQTAAKAVGVLGALISVSPLVLMPVLRKRDNKRMDDECEEIDRFYDRCARALRVPEKAPEVDIHTLFYEVKDGVRQNYHASGAYLNEVMHVFQEDGKLCFYCSDRVWAVPLSSIEEFVRVDEKILFCEWNKETPHNEGKYAQYCIKECEDYEYSMSDYYRIRFTVKETPYELLIPSYDIEPFLEIVPLTGETK